MVELAYSYPHLYLDCCVLMHEDVSDSFLTMKYNKIIALAVFSVLSLCTTFIQKCSPGFDCVTTSVSDNVISQQVLKILYYIKLSDWTKATVIMNMSVFKQNIFSPLWNLF